MLNPSSIFILIAVGLLAVSVIPAASRPTRRENSRRSDAVARLREAVRRTLVADGSSRSTADVAALAAEATLAATRALLMSDVGALEVADTVADAIDNPSRRYLSDELNDEADSLDDELDDEVDSLDSADSASRRQSKRRRSSAARRQQSRRQADSADSANLNIDTLDDEVQSADADSADATASRRSAKATRRSKTRRWI